MHRQLSSDDLATAPCLVDGRLSEVGKAFILAGRRMGGSPIATVLRTWCVPYLFRCMEDSLSSHRDPYEVINIALRRLTSFLSMPADIYLEDLLTAATPVAKDAAPTVADLESITGEHYGKLFEAFSHESHFTEAANLLRTRLERNGIAIEDLDNKVVLDAGCGGGRYTVAWKLLGARRCIGCDVSGSGLDNARRRINEAGLEGVEYEHGNVLELRYADNMFDIVFSNGVLHHTRDWKQGVGELVRVLKSNGLGWLYLIEDPGGLFWDVIELLRIHMREAPRGLSRAALGLIGLPANRIFYMLDHVMVPINLRLRPVDVEKALQDSGARDIRRLTRGADFDRVEHIYRRTPFAADHFGVGENRYIFTK